MFNFVRIAKQREKLIAQLSSETSASYIRFLHLVDCLIFIIPTHGSDFLFQPRFLTSHYCLEFGFFCFSFVLFLFFSHLLENIFKMPPHFKWHFPILFSFVPFISDPFSGKSSLVTFISVRVFSPPSLCIVFILITFLPESFQQMTKRRQKMTQKNFKYCLRFDAIKF